MFNVYSECDLKSRPEGNEYNIKKTFRSYGAINIPPLRGLTLNTKHYTLNMSPLRGLTLNTKHYTLNMSPLRG